MADLPHPWDVYASVQAQLSDRARVSDRAWGLETALNRLLAHEPADPAHVPIAQATAERRARYSRSLMARHQSALVSELPSTDAQMEARSALVFLGRHLSTPDMVALVNAGLGHKAVSDIARQRLSRVRRRARTLLGH